MIFREINVVLFFCLHDNKNYETNIIEFDRIFEEKQVNLNRYSAAKSEIRQFYFLNKDG